MLIEGKLSNFLLICSLTQPRNSEEEKCPKSKLFFIIYIQGWVVTLHIPVFHNEFLIYNKQNVCLLKVMSDTNYLCVCMLNSIQFSSLLQSLLFCISPSYK